MNSAPQLYSLLTAAGIQFPVTDKKTLQAYLCNLLIRWWRTHWYLERRLKLFTITK